MTSEDCHAFDHMLVLHGEVPPMRYEGIHKNLGPQYVRGIVEETATRRATIWNTYSVNKEDIWVSRTRLPITGTVDRRVNDSFEDAATVDDLELWNTYSPYGRPFPVVGEPGNEANHCLGTAR